MALAAAITLAIKICTTSENRICESKGSRKEAAMTCSFERGLLSRLRKGNTRAALCLSFDEISFRDRMKTPGHVTFCRRVS